MQLLVNGTALLLHDMPELFVTTIFSDANLGTYLRMEGNSNDSKGSNNGTDHSMSYSTGAGRFGQGASFNGSSSYIDLPIALNGNANGTWTMWIKTSTSQNVYIAGNNTMAGHYSRWQQNASDKVGFTFFNGTDTVGVTAPNAITDGFWHMYTATWGSAGMVLYVDGASVGTDAHTSGPDANNDLFLGVLNNNGSPLNYWAGSMDDVAIFNDALTAAEVQTLYASSGFFNFFN